MSASRTRDLVLDPKLAAEQSYWLARLASDLQPSNIWADYRRMAGAAEYAQLDFLLSPDLCGQLVKLAGDSSFLLYTTFVAALEICLHKHSGQNTIVVGSPARKKAETAQRVFNLVAIVAEVDDEVSFRKFLLQVRQTLLEAYAHQMYPMALVARDRGLSWNGQRSPLFDIVMSMEDIHEEMPQVAADMKLWLERSGERVQVRVEYDRKLYEEASVRGLLRHLCQLLEAGLKETDKPLKDLRMAGAEEERQVIVEWNRTERAYGGRSVVALFEEQARRRPAAEALVYEEKWVSYGDLNERANRLARYLRKKGVKREELVGVVMERSVEMVVGLLGVLKAGGAYVPVDPEYPEERMRYMLEDSGARVVLTQERLREKVRKQMGAGEREAWEMVRVDGEWEEIREESGEGLGGEVVEGGHLAYVIYTSGSTGRPKGVMVPHEPLAMRVEAMVARYNLGPDQRLLQFVSFSFDAFAEELFPVLSSGAALLIHPRPQEVATIELLQWCERHGATALHFPAAYWHRVADDLILQQTAAPKWIQLLIIGGESPATEKLLALAPRMQQSLRAFNVYGPTEATITAAWYQIPLYPVALARLQNLPIGRPLPNTEIYLLDSDMKPAPVGVPGEIYIGGGGLARGYRGAPDLTASGFIPHPFAAGRRLYKTGDLGRYRADGNIEFLGRNDQQIKIRGYRVEMEEIEAVLRSFPKIRESAVIAHEGPGGEKRLHAYVALEGEPDFKMAELKQYLQQKLPDYMIPSAFVRLNALPLSPNGKIDRRVLVTLQQNGETARPKFEAPRTPVERTLAAIWSQLLGIEHVGIHDNFFELGGDSILSLQCVARANQAGIRLTPRKIFEHPAIAELVRVLEGLPETIANQAAVSGHVPLTPIQSWFFARNIPQIHHYNQSLLLEIAEDADIAAIRRSVEAILAHHDALRMRFRKSEAEWEQWNAGLSSETPFHVVDLSGLQPAGQSQAIEDAAARVQTSLDIGAGPLFRVVFFKLGSGRHGVLLIAIHHLVVDGVSWRILLEDLQSAYAQLKSGKQADFPLKTDAFKDWAERLREYGRSAEARQQLDAWAALASLTLPDLPAANREGMNTVASARVIQVSLDEEHTGALLREVPRAYGIRINDVLLSALALAYRSWTGESAVLIDLEGHGREEIAGHIDVSRTVGCFTVIYPILLEAPAHEDGKAVLRRTREQLKKIPAGGIGYGVLRYLSDDGEGRAGLQNAKPREISFNYLGQFDQVFSSGTLFRLTLEDPGPTCDKAATRAHLLDLAASIADGRLTISWSYSENVHKREDIQDLAEKYRDELRKLIVECGLGHASGRALSDFPLAGLDQAGLDKLISATKKAVEDIYPLSPLQEGMIFHDLYAPSSGVHIAQFVYLLQSRIEVPVLGKAWQCVVDRHSVLRTCFYWESHPAILQVVHQHAQVPFAQTDWRGLSQAEQKEKLELFLRTDRLQGFNLATPPLMRLTLFQLAEDSFRLVWTIHHVLGDGWCTSVLLGEVLELYDGLTEGREAELAEPRRYRDYIEWLQEQDMEKAEKFWREELKGFRSPVRVRGELAAGEEWSEAGPRKEHVWLGREVSERLRGMARENMLTVNTLVQGAWGLVLSGYNGSADVVFGATVSGRPAGLKGVEQMVGLFINTLAVRVQVREEEGVVEWLKRLQGKQLEAREYEYSPLARVQSWSEVERGEALFESILVFENYPIDETLKSQAGRLRVGEAYAVEQTNYPLTVQVVAGDQIRLQINYEQSYSRGQIQRMLKHMVVVLEGMAGGQGRVGALPRMSEEEERQVIEEWNRTERAYEGRSVVELFEEQAGRRPGAEAVVYEGERVSYGELNERANRLARYLRKKGVKREELVGVVMERSVEMVVGLLGVLKAGGAYVPVDPEYPEERMRYMLEDSGARVVLTQERLREKVSRQMGGVERGAWEMVRVDGEWEEIRKESGEGLGGEAVEGGQLAYVIYTSGSTGRPKGAMNTHGGISNRLQWMQETFALGENDRVLQKTPFSFDVSVWEFFWPLMYGARLVVARPGGHQDSGYLLELIGREEVTTVHFVPSMLEAFAEEKGLEERGGSLRRVICSGEVLGRELSESVHRRLAGAEVYNLYGPTEAAVDVTSWRCERGERRRKVPIGRAIGNLRLYVLDEGMKAVPIGAVGELYIGGVGVGRGYRGQAGQTGERYVPDPFGREAGGRLYRTGDQVRYLSDGNLDYVGRVDDQVKIRGMRIELGEIEAVMREAEGVREAAVRVWEGEDGRRRLVGYVVGRSGEEVSEEQVRRRVRARLPEHMVPAVMVKLEQMPLTSSGKISRRDLPAVASRGGSEGKQRIKARTVVEEVLAGIWARVLGVEEIGIHDNFFELGGDSILSIRVRAQAQRLGIGFSLEQLLHFRTIHELARAISTSPAEISSTQYIEPFALISSDDRRKIPETIEDAYPLAALQTGMLFHEELGHTSGTYHDIFSAHLQVAFDREAFDTVIRDMVRRHPALRVSFHPKDFNVPLQLVHKEAHLLVEYEDLRDHSPDVQEQILARWKAEERRHRFEAEVPPLLRFYFHRRTDDSLQFTLSFHHAILDGWSVAAMISELFSDYFALLERTQQGKLSPRISYGDFVALERAALQSPEIRQYWEQKLNGATLTNVTDRRQRPDETPSQTETLALFPPPAVAAGIMKLVHSTGIPLRSALLAVHFRVLALLSGQSDVVTGYVSNSRPEELDGDRILGLFLNTIPLRLSLTGGTWRDLAILAFQVEREAFPFRRLPLVEIQRQHKGNPLFEVLFGYTNFHIYRPLEGELRVISSDGFEQTNFPLAVACSSAAWGDELAVRFIYDSSRLSTGRAETFSRCWKNALESMAHAPSALYQYQCLVPEDEKRLLLFDWNQTDVDHVRRTVVELFEEQVRRSPEVVAVVYEEEKVSYRELNERVNRLARYLRKKCVEKEELVAVVMERSVAMAVALFGVLKAGGAYVPVDSGNSQERIRYVLEDAGVRIVLTQEHLLRTLVPEAGPDTTVFISLDTVWDEVTAENPQDPEIYADAAHPAYVIYTSGSTGAPKGVVITHDSLRNHMLWMQREYPLRPEDRVLQKTLFTFDASVWEFYAPLLVGAQLIMAPPQANFDLSLLAKTVFDQQITIFQAVPSVLWWLLEQHEFVNCRRLRRVFCGGEALTNELQDRFFERVQADLINLYGPTETTIEVTSWRCRGGSDSSAVPIGRPIDNAGIFILDAYLQPVPAGVTGELYVGGQPLARGYHRRPELTAERFIPNPFAAILGERLYRTGDTARYREDGALEFVDRIDQQVKIRGYRIELEEIEAVLRQQACVMSAAVAISSDMQNIRQLVAYVIPRASHTTEELRTALYRRLPAYMIPAVFVQVESLPTLPNGKIDRNSLPALRQMQGTVLYIAPRTEIEREIASVWRGVLELPKVSRDDNFFQLGGDSLLLWRVHSQLKVLFSRDLSMADMFRYPTVRALGEHLAGSESRQPSMDIDVSEKRKLGKARLQHQLRQRHQAAGKGKGTE